MPDAWTAGKLSLIEPANGAYVDTWDTPLAANWISIDAAVSGTTTVTLSNLNVLLVTPKYPTSPNPAAVTNSTQNLRLLLTGTISANLTVSIPSGIPGMWIIDNQVTGSYIVTVNTAAPGSTGITPPVGYLSYIFSDGTNVRYADEGAIVVKAPKLPTGTVIQFAGNLSFPSGFLNCDGSAISRTAYADLFAVIGTTWGAGDGLTTFNLPQLQNMFIRGAGGSSPAGTYETASVLAHNHSATVTDPGHVHSIYHSQSVSGTDGYVGGGSPNQGTGTFGTYPAGTGISVTVGVTGGENRPENYRLWFLIKT